MATTIDELQVEISAITKDFKRDIASINGQLDGVSKQAKKSSDVLQKMGQASKLAILAIGGATVAGVGMAVKAYADYEQLVGGVETLFKSSSDLLKKYSEEAYRTAGVSANEYMETAISFSGAMLKGLGGDTQRAAEMSNQAIIDMADNVNKLGSNAELVKNAYIGMAKGNFTMLDNLNLGIKPTQEGMAELINQTKVMGEGFVATAENVKDVPFDKMTEAIHKLQVETGIAGTTSKEASETISGSWAAVKSSFENVLTGVEGSGEAFADTALNLASQLAKKVPEIAGRLAGGVTKALTTLLSKVNWSEVYSTIIPSEEIREGINSTFASISGAFTNFWAVVKPAIVWFKEVLWPIIVQVAEYVGGQLKSAWDSIVSSFKILAPVLKVIGAIIGGVVVAVLVILVAAIVAVISVIATVINWITKLAEAFFKMGADFIRDINLIIDSIVTFYNAVVKWFGDAWNAIKAIWGVVAKWFGNVFNGIMSFFSQIPGKVGNFFRSAWNAVTSVWNGVANWFRDKINGVFNFFGNVPGKIKGYFGDAWNAVKNINWLQLGRDIVAGIANGLNPGIIVDRMKNIASNALNAVKSFLGIKSPSRVMRDQVGKMMGAGLAEGIDASTKEAVKSAANSASRVMSAYSGMSAGIPTNSQLNGKLSMAVNARMPEIDSRQTPVNVQLDGNTLLSFVIDGVNGKSFLTNQTSIIV